MTTTPIRVLLELRPDRESLTGRVHRDGRPDREFAGWLGLMAALQAVVAGDTTSGGDAGTGGDHERGSRS